MKRGLLTERQYRVLQCRGKGLTQSETARELHSTRANISMIEMRARRKIDLARESLLAYQTTLTDHSVRIPRGTKLYDIPPAVLREGDKFGIHIQGNIVEIIRMVKDSRPTCLEGGRTNRTISFVFNQKGKLRLGQASK
jgi:HTH-type transcriptional regulator, fmd operon transcriptional regulator